MSNFTPLPDKTNTLARLKQDIPITSIVDVGIREATPELINLFPEKKHYLFEPASTFFEDIKRNYKNMDYDLFPIALSDKDGEIYLITRSLEKNGLATHSGISDSQQSVDGLHILSCTPIEVKRFDSLQISKNIESNYLLKVDVDGQDLTVLKGFGNSLRNASAVIVECTTGNFVERIAYVIDCGFSVTDIVDIVYYGDSLYQFDAVLVRNDLITEQIKPTLDPFKRELWKPLTLNATMPRRFSLFPYV